MSGSVCHFRLDLETVFLMHCRAEYVRCIVKFRLPIRPNGEQDVISLYTRRVSFCFSKQNLAVCKKTLALFKQNLAVDNGYENNANAFHGYWLDKLYKFTLLRFVTFILTGGPVIR